jgi:peptide/nickel transport system substrate-binding protein
MASYWAEIGVTVDLLEKEQAVWSQDFNESKFDINLQAHSGSLGNADSVIGRLYYSGTEKRHNFADPEVDALIEQAKSTLDDDERYALYAEAEERIWELAPGIWPMDLNGVYAVNGRVQGFEPQPDQRPLFAGVSLSNP